MAESEAILIPKVETEEIGENKNVSEETEKLNTNSGETKAATCDPYAYLNRDEFSSERFKIEINNLPKYFGAGHFKKFLHNKMGLNPHKIKPVGRFVFVCFRSDEERDQALNKLQDANYKGSKLQVKIAKAMQDPLVKKRKQESAGDSDNKKQKTEDNGETVEERVRKATLGMGDLAYDQQLLQKKEKNAEVMKNLTREIRKANYPIKSWIDKQAAENDGLVCKLNDVMPSPVLTGYRNKCDFTVGMNPDTNELTVGFRTSSYKKGSHAVGPIANLPHLPAAMKEVVSLFQDHFRTSGKKAFDPEDHSGYWRSLMIRTSTTGNLMAIVVIHPQNLTEDELEALKNELVELAENGPGKGKLTSLYFQAFSTKKSGEEPAMEHLWGSTHLREILCGLEFLISPTAFFQVNTKAAEVLYDKVAGCAKSGPGTTVLDICCGTGTIGLTLAKKCGKVLGVELIASAVEDARRNAEANGITNCDFVAGKAEDLLPSLLSQLKDTEEAVAIVDPPRAGLHTKGIQMLRKAAKIQRLVYVSCDARAAMKSFVDLCRMESNAYQGTPFIPVEATPVDLFPDTPHCELVIVFQRYQAEQK